jgi:hypothetical protein
MNFLKKIFGSKKTPPATGKEDFWDWFSRHSAAFHNIVKTQKEVDGNFLERLIPRLHSIHPQFYCLTGMLDDDTAELIVTSDGVLKLFVFVEEFIQAAPPIPGWKFTALKPPTDIKSFSLDINGYSFSSDNIHFCYIKDENYPDEIDISLIYEHFTEENKDQVTQGCLLFVENSLGEINMATMIDKVTIAPGCPQDIEPIPIAKLAEFITWREKELVEKYESTYFDMNMDEYALMEAEDTGGMPVIAVVNQRILEWDAKASHPWMMVVEINYDGKHRNGMPDKKTNELMDLFEDALNAQLPQTGGYLNLGRETYKNQRSIFFACKEFRNVSKATATVISQYQQRLEVSYDIYKDRYWRSLDHFRKSRTI